MLGLILLIVFLKTDFILVISDIGFASYADISNGSVKMAALMTSLFHYNILFRKFFSDFRKRTRKETLKTQLEVDNTSIKKHSVEQVKNICNRKMADWEHWQKQLDIWTLENENFYWMYFSTPSLITAF